MADAQDQEASSRQSPAGQAGLARQPSPGGATASSELETGAERARRIAAAVCSGDIRLGARLMRDLDDRRPGASAVLRLLWPHTGRAYIIGITGNPGAGKSTVVDGLIALYRQQGLRVGVVSIDPTSPFSGGAILGDRIRMMRHATDEGVFIRSLATRGHLGGLSRSTAEVVAVLDAMGYQRVLVETVGVGQAEVDVVSQADTTVVVTVPGLGDEVQAIKAGILEIADVLVVNKADREGAERAVRDLSTMLELRPRHQQRTSAGSADPHGHHGPQPVEGDDHQSRSGSAVVDHDPHAGPPPVEIIRTVALRGQGVDELAAAIARHQARLDAGGDAIERRRRRVRAELRDAVLDRLAAHLDAALNQEAQRVAAVAARSADPVATAELILAQVRARLAAS